MDNIIIKKVYDEDGLIELRVQATAEFVNVYQSCYVQSTDLKDYSDVIVEYSKNYSEDCYIEFGNKEGDYTPAFSLNFLKADMRGHVVIEVDMEIADNEERTHRCCFYVKSELGIVTQFGKLLNELVTSEINTEVKLHW